MTCIARKCGRRADLATVNRISGGAGLAPELERRGIGHFVRARLVGRGIGRSVVPLHQTVTYQVSFDLFATDIGEHMAVDHDARAEHLPALFNHFLALGRIVDDVTVFERQIIFAQHSADALAPAASGLQVSDNFRFIHNSVMLNPATGRAEIKAVSQHVPPLTLDALLWTLETLNVLIIPDKFKGTLTAGKVAAALARGWRQRRPKDNLQLLPMTDGGDGFGETFGELLRAKARNVRALDAAGRNIPARWWFDPKTWTAIIESARVVGLATLPAGRFHPFELDTYGLGVMIRAAARAGAQRCIMGLGGSATNDGGFGMARALGWRFLDRMGREIEQWTGLTELERVRRPSRRQWFRELKVAVDVVNPLLGTRGASRVYGPQKGLKPTDFGQAERALRRLARVMRAETGVDCAKVAGAGAAGGLGFGFLAFLDGELISGFELFAQQTRFERRLHKFDLVITGEGAMDRSTLMGKGVGEIAKWCRKFKIPCLGVAGNLAENVKLKAAFKRVHWLTELTTLDQAKARSAFWLERLGSRLAADWPDL